MLNMSGFKNNTVGGFRGMKFNDQPMKPDDYIPFMETNKINQPKSKDIKDSVPCNFLVLSLSFH
jgi:hypothetical protein